MYLDRLITRLHKWVALTIAVLWQSNVMELAAQSFWKQTHKPTDKAIFSLAGSMQGYVFAGTGGDGVFRSSDYGDTWQQFHIGLRDTVLALLADSRGRIWAGTQGHGVFISSNSGQTWFPGDIGLKNSDIFSLAVGAQEDIFIGTGSNGIFRVTEESQNWKKVTKDLIKSSVLSFAINSRGEIFAGTRSEGIFHSSNNGTSWAQINTGLTNPNIPRISALALSSRDEIFAGTFGNGVFRFNADSVSWTEFNKGLTNTRILTLVSNRQGYVFTGSNGSGVFRSKDDDENWMMLNDAALSAAQVYSHAIDKHGVIFWGTIRSGVFRSIHPIITHTATSKHAYGSFIPIRANISEDIRLERVSLYFRKGGDRDSITVPMYKSGEEYVQSIPSESVTSRGVEYFITASAINGLSNREPMSGVHSISIEVDNEIKPTDQPYGSDETSYRLFSVPLDLENKDARAVLEDDLGQYKNSEWRFYELRADSNYYELPDVSIMSPGKAFWLIVRRARRVIGTGRGQSIRTDMKYSIPLHPRWNFVANPFNFTIPVRNLSLKRKKEMPELRSYQGHWNDITSDSLRVKEIQPFDGYAIFVESPDTLLVNPDMTDSTGFLFPKTRASTNDESKSWRIRIHAQCKGARDADNVAVISPSASAQRDDLDLPEPPVIGEYVSVYFPHREWNTLAKTYCIDARPEPNEGEVWDFEVKTNLRDKVILSFEGIANVPSEFEVWLVDEALQITQNLRESPVYSVAGSEHPKALKLVVGKAEFIKQQLAEINLIPATYELSQNFPNPFNPVTTIRYGLPQAERVTLKIYSVLGEEIATLVDDEHKAAGYHVAIWNGRGKNGNLAASGVYVYRMRAGSFATTKKLLLVK